VVDELHLFRDLLDKQLLDANDRPLGKADGVLFEIRADAPPRLVAVEVGNAAMLRRISERLADGAVRLAKRLGVSSGEPLRIRPDEIVHFGNDVQVDVDAPRTLAYAWERWLKKTLISRIPGSGE
jgi:hypothetical protein